MLLQQIFKPTRIRVGVASEDKDELFEELVDIIAKDEGRGFPRQAALEAIRERESKMSTGIKKGIALPHGKAEELKGLYGAIGISRRGIDYNALDQQPVFIVFMVLSSPRTSELHLGVLKRLAQLLDDPGFYTALVNAPTSERAFEILKDYEGRLTL